jgi:hypothetical protein
LIFFYFLLGISILFLSVYPSVPMSVFTGILPGDYSCTGTFTAAAGLLCWGNLTLGSLSGGGSTLATIDDTGNITRGVVSQNKQVVEAATDGTLGGNVTLIAASAAYNATGGTSGRGQITATPLVAGVFAVDGATLSEGSRVLIKNESGGMGAEANGIWVVTTLTITLVLDRATDFDGDIDVFRGVQTTVAGGLLNADTTWQMITNSPVVGGAGGTPLNWIQITIRSTSTIFVGGAESAPSVSGAGNTILGPQSAQLLTLGLYNTVGGWNAANGAIVTEAATIYGAESYCTAADGDLGPSAYGYRSMYNFQGFGGTSYGYRTMETGFGNRGCMFGYESMLSGDGSDNCGFGVRVMRNLTNGYDNCSFGNESMRLATEAALCSAYGRYSLYSCTTGTDNTGVGYQSLFSLSTAQRCVGLGAYALLNNNANFNTVTGWSGFGNNTAGTRVTGMGYRVGENSNANDVCLFGYESGFSNTAASVSGFGSQALRVNTALGTTGLGYRCLWQNTSGTGNTGGGYLTLSANTIGLGSTGFGHMVLSSNDANANSGYGYMTLSSNTTGLSNSGYGYEALFSNTTANYSCGFGVQALRDSNVEGSCGFGYQAGQNNTGTRFTTMGFSSLPSNQGDGNSGYGYAIFSFLTSGNRNTGMGADVGPTLITGSDCVLIGEGADVSSAAAVNRVVIGQGAIGTMDNTAQIGNAAMVGGVQAYGNYLNISDATMKENIRDSDLGLDFIRAIRPVSFSYKMEEAEQGRSKRVDYGVIAQELQVVLHKFGKDNFKGLTNDGIHYFVSYSSLIGPIIQAIQELSQRIDAPK